MAFIPYSYGGTEAAEWVYLPAGDAAWTVGKAAYDVSGVMEPVSTGAGDTTDGGNHYIAMFEETIAASGAVRPFILASKAGLVLESELSVASASIAKGTKYTIDSTGGKVTATTAKGCCEVIDYDGKTAGDKVRVRVI